MLARPLLPFLDTYSLSTSSLGCKALCIVTSFLVLWFIWWSSFLVLFKNGPEYLTWEIVLVFIYLLIFLLCCLVSSSFFVLLRVKKKFLPFYLFNGVRFQYTQVFVSFRFSVHSVFIYWFVVLILPSCVVSHYMLLAWHIFLYRITFLNPDCIASLPILGFRNLDIVHVHSVFYLFLRFS